jgi:hypothetical protein
MPKYKLTVKETVWHTFVFVSGETEREDVVDYFYEMEPDEQEAAKRSSESYEWEVEEIEVMETPQ